MLSIAFNNQTTKDDKHPISHNGNSLFIFVKFLQKSVVLQKEKNIFVKVLGLVGIRKLMDFAIFTQRDLSYLDDIMPEFVRLEV